MKKILLVTGASSDIGIRLIESVFKEYDLVYLQYRAMNADLESVILQCSASTPVISLQGDFCNIDGVSDLIAAIRANGELPNNIVHLPSPKAYNQKFHKDEWSNFDLGWNISVRSIALILQAFIQEMSKSRYGRVVFMLTSCTENMPPKYQASYVTVKYALLGLMRSLAVEYANRGITINGVSPDMIETKFLSELPSLIVESNKERSPLGRNIRIDEVVPTIKYLLSDSSSAITGQNIAITGGL